jgi:hypothetical protein
MEPKPDEKDDPMIELARRIHWEGKGSRSLALQIAQNAHPHCGRMRVFTGSWTRLGRLVFDTKDPS